MHTFKIFACEICEKTFSTNKNIVKHMSIIHGEEKKFECNVCTLGTLFDEIKLSNYLQIAIVFGFDNLISSKSVPKIPICNIPN